MKSAGFDIVGVKEGILGARDAVINSLLSQRQDTKGREDLLKVAKISANGETSIAE